MWRDKFIYYAADPSVGVREDLEFICDGCSCRSSQDPYVDSNGDLFCSIECFLENIRDIYHEAIADEDKICFYCGEIIHKGDTYIYVDDKEGYCSIDCMLNEFGSFHDLWELVRDYAESEYEDFMSYKDY